jgi:hypothetical protein
MLSEWLPVSLQFGKRHGQMLPEHPDQSPVHDLRLLQGIEGITDGPSDIRTERITANHFISLQRSAGFRPADFIFKVEP